MSKTGAAKIVVIALALNAAALLVLLGAFIYTRVLYKRPVITEEQQRKYLEAELDKKEKARIAAFVPTTYKIAPFEANLKSTTSRDRILSIGISLEMSDQSFQSMLEAKKPQFMNQLNQMIAGTSPEEIQTIQGRLLFKSKVLGIISEILKVEKGPAPVTDLYFTQFIIQ